jgi:D-alanyl-D-alanine carboxypeptidase
MKIVNICGLVLWILYTLTFFAMLGKTKKKKHKIGKYFKVSILFIVILAFVNIILVLNESDKKPKDVNKTTTSSEVITEKTSEVTTMEKTTTKASSGTYKKLNYDLSGASDKGTTSKGYSIQEKDGITYIDGYMIANKTYGLPESFNPGKLDATVEKAAAKMYEAAKSEKGYNMWGQSQFRSYETQKKLYNNYVARDGKAAADTYSARPGFSEHQTGLAFDVCAKNKPCITSDFNSTPEAKWLSDNAWRFGFILRYVNGKTNETGYKYESWHFRYVGKDIAEKLYNNGDWITLEDYFGITSEYNE